MEESIEEPEQGKRSRSWCWTINNYDDALERDLATLVDASRCVYLTYGREVGENGTNHLQGFVYFKNAVRLNTVRCTVSLRGHYEVMRGNFEQAILYCHKDGEFVEFGEKPMSAKRKGELEAERWNNAKQLAISGNIDDIDSDIYVRCYSSLKSIRNDHMPKITDLDDVCGVWIFGPSGCGKSQYSRTHWPDAYTKPLNKWWDGYDREENVILDDVDPSHAQWIAHFLKYWTDKYAFIGERKGNSVRIRPKQFVITSQYDIATVFASSMESYEALLRRCKVIDFIKDVGDYRVN